MFNLGWFNKLPDLITLVVLRHLCIQSKYNRNYTTLLANFDIRVCQTVYSNLGKNGLLEKQEKEQTYCEECKKYATSAQNQSLSNLTSFQGF